jgi:catechol 2,3-dioxygenase-like lactoylglutathione lyase family enzyme
LNTLVDAWSPASAPARARPGIGPGLPRARPADSGSTLESEIPPSNFHQEASMSASKSVKRKVPMNLENQIIPVTDVDRAKGFYEQLGWRLDDDVAPFDGLRIVQFTPPGSGTSVTFGQGLSTAAPGSAEGGLVVSDIEEAYDELADRGIEVSDVWHGPPFPVEARQPGPDPERASYGSFCSFTDPDGNLWIVQEVTTRKPGRVE